MQRNHQSARWRFPFLFGAAVFAAWCLVIYSGCFHPARPTTKAEAVVEEEKGPPWFVDATDELGLDFVHDAGPTGSYFMPQSFGSGCAFIEDPDGTLYVYLLQCAGPSMHLGAGFVCGGAVPALDRAGFTPTAVNRLYRRLPSGKFQDVTAGSGLDIAGYNHGVAVGDINNDGLPDVVVTQYGGVKLFLNRGGGHFEDVSEEAGVGTTLWCASAAFVDYDRDGLLDLLVVAYVDYDPKKDCFAADGGKDFCGPKQQRPTCCKLYHNLGAMPAKDGKPAARVRFEDVSFASGIGQLAGPGLGIVCADFDGDGWPDFFISNDGQPNRLWMNQHDGTFVDEAVSRGVAYNVMGNAFAGMGVAVGDTTNSGLLDLYVTHLNQETNTLWRQDHKRGYFRDRTADANLLASRWHGTGFGTLFADFDLDGALDLAVVNGRVYRGSPARNTGLGFWEVFTDRNQLFANDGTGKFRDVSEATPAFCGRWNVGRGLACADINDDGAPDLLVTSIGDRARLYRNIAPDRGHWLKVRAIDPKLKRDVYGAEVHVRCGQRQYLRLIYPADSFLCSSLPTALFGLGNATHVDSVLVVWPDGKPPEEFDGGPVDRLMILRRGEGHAP
jgi:enediyne biosynthesis protein E4